MRWLCLILSVSISLSCTTRSFGREKMELTLEESIQIALKKSSSLAIANAKVKESRAKVGEARAGLFPQVSANGSYTRLDEAPSMSLGDFPMLPPGTPAEIKIGDDDMYNSAISVQQPLFTGFRIMNGYSMARYGARAEEFNYQKARSDVIFNVENTFYEVLKAQEFEKVSEQALEQMKSHVRDLENMYKVGMIAENDLLKAKVQLSDTRLMTIRAANGVRIAKTAFLSGLGIPLDTEVVLKAKLEYKPIPPVGLESAVNEALEERPEIKAMQYNLKIGRKAVSVSRAQWLPSVFLVGNYNYKRPDRTNKWNWYDSWDVTLAVEMNIFDWGAIYYQTSQAKHGLRQMEEGSRQLRDGITLEVTQSYLFLQEAQEKIEVAQKNVEQAEENYRVTQEKFKQGMATNTDLLDANTMLIQAKMEHVQALADHNVAKAMLEKAMGVLVR